MIHPDYINGLIHFYPGTSTADWQYDMQGKDMRSLQINGAAHLYNLLQQPPYIALLADEVGMGKTIQALSVITALLHRKPDAKILILAPRDEIVRNWEKEYQTFVSNHYRHTDDVIKTALGGTARHKMVYCRNLYSLVHEVNQGWAQLFIGKISSFSSLFSSKNVRSLLQKLQIANSSHFTGNSEASKLMYNQQIAQLLRDKILSNTAKDTPYFDLVVIDEAHFFRRKASGSLRVEVAKHFFGDPELPNAAKLAHKVLLMTATPNHSHASDILNMVSYFTTDFQGKTYQDVLNQICVRRLRRLGQGERAKNKYNYREEKPSASDFKGNPLAETFFALYQHELAKQAKKHSGSSKTGSASMIKYLEGLEFIPHEMANDTTNEEEKKNSTDFKKGHDTELLVTLSQRFRKIFNEHPNHPKYDKLIDDLTKEGVHEKAVVFVRRIPSVKEITQRVLAKYDEQFWALMPKSPNKTLKLADLTRASFNRIHKPDNAEVDDLLSDESKDESISAELPQEGIPESKVLNLFKILKSGKEDVRTTAANFRLRFNASKPGIFALFFSPASDYDKEPYRNLQLFKFEVGKKELDHYYRSAVISRCNHIPNHKKPEADEIRNLLVSTKEIEGQVASIPTEIHTFFSLFWQAIEADKQLPMNQKDALRAAYGNLNYYEKEALSRFIEKGALLASEAMVWMFQLYTSLEMESNKQLEEYQAFAAAFLKELPLKRLYKQTQDSILHFKTIYTKVRSISNDKALLEEKWEIFNNAQPIYPYSADNKNTGVREAFNTPFFPDYLVATSVLQEGVNLQYFCKRMYHYGMAWTPGDNEQRIGRIDRMFGQIERELIVSEDARLPIFYPYLKDTVDEEQLARFAKRKYREEGLIDLGKAPNDGAEYLLEDNLNEDWQSFLRQHPTIEEIKDPFPVPIERFASIRQTEHVPGNKDHIALVDQIAQAFSTFAGNTKVQITEHQHNYSILVNPLLPESRNQPVMAEIMYDPIGSGKMRESVYCLRLKTPLAAANKYKLFNNSFYQSEVIQKHYLPNVKLCLDNGKEVGSYWSIYMCVDLPLFTNQDENPLSVEEVHFAFESLITCADVTERSLFKNQDLDLATLNLSISDKSEVAFSRLRNADSSVQPILGWSVQDDFLIRENVHNTVDLKAMMLANHLQYYSRLHCINEQVIIQTSKHNVDVQKMELEVLNFHHVVTEKQMIWIRRSEDTNVEDD